MSHRSPTSPSAASAATTGKSHGPRRQANGGLFEDFNFRFGNTYTVVERSEPPASGAGGPLAPLPPAGGAAALRLTSHFVTTLEEQRRDAASGAKARKKDGRRTAALSNYGKVRRSQVLPAFAAAASSSSSPAPSPPVSSAPATATGAVEEDATATPRAIGRDEAHEPLRRPLPPPSLGLAVGIDAALAGEGGQTGHPLSAGEENAILSKERQANAELFQWWDEREAARRFARFRAQLDAALQPSLENSCRDMIAREETHWLEELSGGQPRLPGTQVALNPRLKSAAAAANDMMAQTNGLTPAAATTRGVTVPLRSIETLFRGVRAMLHERAGKLLSTYDQSRKVARCAHSPEDLQRLFAAADDLLSDDSDDDEGGGGSGGAASPGGSTGLDEAGRTFAIGSSRAVVRRLAKEARHAYLKRLAETETKLAREALRTASLSAADGTDTSSAGLTPACVSLPPEHLLAPLMAVETATGVALMWKILEQVRSVVPGMEFALQLYRHHIIPHIYDEYAAFDGILPHQMGSLCDQVGRLSGLPLRARSSLLAIEAVQQTRADADYMEYAMKRWALRTWRKSVADRHRRHVAQAACTGLLNRAARRARLASVFGAWRLQTCESGHARYLRHVDRAYNAFLAGSALTEKMGYLPTGPDGGDGGGDLLTFHNRTRIIATKLAETATHTKPTKKKKPEEAPDAAAAAALVPHAPPPAAPDAAAAAATGRSSVATRVSFSRRETAATDGGAAAQHPHPQQQQQSSSRDADPRFSVNRAIGEKNVFLPVVGRRTVSSAASSAAKSEADRVAADAGERQARVKEATSGRLKELFRSTQSSARSADASSEGGERPQGVGAASGMASAHDVDNPLCDGSGSSRPATQDGDVVAEPPHSARTRRHFSSDDDDAFGGGAGGDDDAATAQLLTGNGPFEKMLSRLRETEEVCCHLRSELAVQSKMITKLEQDKRGLQERNRALEADLLRTVEEKLHYCNVVQEKQFQLHDRDRRITQLKSRLRAHRNRPWQRVVMRVVGELCGSSTQLSEAVDEERIRRDFRTDPNSAGANGNGVPPLGLAGAGASGTGDGITDEDADRVMGLVEDGPAAREAEQERLFGALAPIVLSSTRQLPDALVILQDWANGCLEDLQSLDDLKGGALSVRFSSFSEEARSGVLLSRLLFYLALPRYLRRTAHNDDGGSGSPHGSGHGRGARPQSRTPDIIGSDFPDRRRQLLEQRNVQLDAPFPVYSECFGDLLSMRPNERMTLLLQFATELVAGCDAPASDAHSLAKEAVQASVMDILDISPPLAAGRIELQEVVDPHALSAGERAAVVTFVALLYTRFAHPFNHKSRRSAKLERAAMLQLLSDGRTNIVATDAHGGTENTNAMTLEEELLANLDDEDKSPWQLFKERCLPLFGTSAHPFLLRGNFWPSTAFDSPTLANLLGELGMALNRSLHLHRWHVILSCLVPVVTYSGLSRGVFTGPRASPAALRVGLEREGAWEFPLHGTCIHRVCVRRFEDSCQPQQHSRSSSPGLGGSEHHRHHSVSAQQFEHVAAQKDRLMRAIKFTSDDLLALFLKRSTLSAELALPTLDLGGWRLMCSDLNVASLELGSEDTCPIDLETATVIYVEAVVALNEASERPKLFAVTAEDSTDGVSYHPAQRTPQGAFITPRGSMPFADAQHRGSGGVSPVDHLPLGNMRDGVSSADLGTSSRISVPNFQAMDAGDVHVQMPVVRNVMTFTAFVTAMVLVADRLYPARPEEQQSAEKEKEKTAAEQQQSASDVLEPHRWLGDALRAMMRHNVLETPAGNILLDEPRAVIRRLQMGAAMQETISLHTPALTLVFNAYSKDVYGAAGMEKEDLMTLLRDAMLTSTEVSQYLVFDLFQYCCTTRRAVEEEAAAKRREMDGKPRVPNAAADRRRGASRAVSILDPRTNAVSSSSGKRRDVQVLVMEGFIDFLCVLCNFKQPNPLIPAHQRLAVFLRRSVLRPLNHKVEGLSSFLNQLKAAREAHEAETAGR